jgi:quercetin dioxygenase-like cupin family protein
MGATDGAVVLGPEEGEFRWGLDGALSRFPITAEQTGGRYAVLEDRVARNDGIPLHRHPGDDEAFYVLEGEVVFTLGDDPEHAAGPGSVVFVSGEVAHSFRIASETARYLIITTPRHAEFYRAISRPAGSRDLPAQETMDMEAVMRACEMYGVEILD